jgi:hypothetical protein
LGASQVWKGFPSLFFQAFHKVVSFACSFFCNCALVIRGFGEGDGDGVAS